MPTLVFSNLCCLACLPLRYHFVASVALYRCYISFMLLCRRCGNKKTLLPLFWYKFTKMSVVVKIEHLLLKIWSISVSEADHSQYDCFACAILTHGGDRDILYSRDKQMKLSDFTRPFGPDKCPSLALKPKLFFIQVRTSLGVVSFFVTLGFLVFFRLVALQAVYMY